MLKTVDVVEYNAQKNISVLLDVLHGSDALWIQLYVFSLDLAFSVLRVSFDFTHMVFSFWM